MEWILANWGSLGEAYIALTVVFGSLVALCTALVGLLQVVVKLTSSTTDDLALERFKSFLEKAKSVLRLFSLYKGN